MTFNQTAGLEVFVDGQLVNANVSGASRMFIASTFSPYQNIVIGQRNDQPLSTTTGVAVWSLSHANVAYTIQQVQTLIANASDALVISCSTSDLTGLTAGSLHVTDTSALTEINICRSYCYKQALHISIFTALTECVCTDLSMWNAWSAVNAQLLTSACSSPVAHVVAWSTHIIFYPPAIPVNLLVTVSNPTSNSYVRPGETISFTVSTNTTESVTFFVNFGDGTSTIVTPSRQVGHSWREEGKYQVNITALTRTSFETKIIPVAITFVDEGVAPQNLLMKLDCDGLTDYNVTSFFQAYSPKTKNCSVNYGDRSPVVSFNSITEYVVDVEHQHLYHQLGFFPVTLTCTNTFGQASQTQVTSSVKSGLIYENVAKENDIVISVIGADGSSNIYVYIDNVPQNDGLLINSTHLTLSSNLFSRSGEHFFLLKANSGTIMMRKIFNVLEPISDIELMTSNVSVEVNETIVFTIAISRGDEMFLSVSYGDGIIETVYVDSAPVTLIRQHAYQTLGTFSVNLMIANGVGVVSVSQSVSVERPLHTVTMSATNVTTRGQPTTFTLTVDPTVTPAMPITVKFIYDDNNTEIVMLGSMRSTPVPLVHTYTYARYGIYRVKAVVMNNISSIILPVCIIQVGENVTAVDVYVANWLVTTNQLVTLTIQCPTGFPVLLQVDMGDGEVVSIKRPSTYDPLTDDLTYPTAADATTNSTRTRRDTSGLIGSPFTITYQYTTPGLYMVTVNVSNSLSVARSSLCPSIMVLNQPTTAPQCQQDVVSIINSATVSQPQVLMRSATLTLSAVANLQCLTSMGHSSPQPLYTWTAERLVSLGVWRPENMVCSSIQPNSSLIIPSNTLWYGTYRINVTASISVDSRPASIDKSAPAATYLTVVPSPLIASITVAGGQTDIQQSDVVNINISASRDPDVISTNTTGVRLNLFCYPESARDIYQKLTLTQLLSTADSLAVNSAENAAVYQFREHPCFTSSTSDLWVMGFEVVFPASYLTTDESIVFALYMTKDTRVANTSIDIHIWSLNTNGSALDSIDDLLRKGDTNAALLVINMVTNNLNGGGEDEEAKKARTQLRGKLIGALGKVSDRLQNVDQIEKTTDVMSAVTSKPDEVKETDKANAAGAIGKTASVAKDLAVDASADKVAGITGSIMSGVGNILPFDTTGQNSPGDSPMTTVAPTHRRRRNVAPTPEPDFIGSEPESVDNETTCCENYTGLCEWIEPEGWLCVDEDDRKSTVWANADCLLEHPDDIREFMRRFQDWKDEQTRQANLVKKTITTNGMGAFGDIGGVLMGKQDDGGAKSISTPNINMTVMKVSQDSGPGLQMEDYSLPAEALATMGSGGGFMMVKSPNAYTYSNTSASVTGSVITLSLNAAGGTSMQVSNSSEPFELWMQGSNDEIELRNFTFLATSGEQYNYHRVDVSDNDTAILAILRPLNSADSFYVYLKYSLDDYPNDTFYDWVGIIPNPDFDVTDDARYHVFPPQNVTSINGTYRFGIRHRAAGDDSSTPANYTYSMYIYTTACRYWSEMIDAWDTSGCAVGPKTTPARTQCLCTHLTSFGGNMAVPPNTIDFKTVFSAEKFLESVPVFSTVISMIVIYILIVIWARHMDKKDIVRWGATPLEDNLPSDTYHYHLSVYTGLKKNAGTTSKPSFILSGDYADTGVRRLYDGKRKEITTGSIYNYVLSVENCLGPLTFLRIWHDNSGEGKKKGWFLDQMQVTDLQTGEKFFFVCNRWMAVEEDDGMIERVLPVACTNDLTQFSQLFGHSVRKKFSNDHMWVSIFSRPTRSTFTRVQRVSACVSLLFLTMIVNCMFFKSANPNHATEIHVGPITLTAQQLFISVVSTCIVLPPSVTIVTIFQKARPKNSAVSDTKAVNTSRKSRWMALDAGSSAMWSNVKRSRVEKMRDAIRGIMTSHQRAKYADEEDEQNQAVKKKKKSMTFPHWTIYIAWTLVVLSVILPGFFTILYSMQWGRTKSIDWLTTFLMSFFQNVIVVQPVKVVILAMVISFIFRKPDTDDDDGSEDNTLKPDEQFLSHSEKDIQEILKQRRSSHAGIDRPNMEALKKARETRLMQIQMDGIIRECVIYLFFVLVVYFISYQERDRRSYLFAQNIKNQFFGGDPAFTNIQTYSDVHAWLNQTLMPNLYAGNWYNGEPLHHWRDAININDRVTIRLGIARLRQLRIKEDTCKIQKQLHSVIDHCRADYNWIDDDTKSYAPGWQPLNDTYLSSECLAEHKKHDIWRYRDTLELKGSPYMGLINTYKGGGYTFNFRRDPRITSVKLAELAASNWLDVRTRGVFVEFTVYNANVNLYGSVIMLIEFLATGSPVFMQEVKVFRLGNYVGPFGIIVVIFQVIYVGFIIYFFVHVIHRLRKQRLAYFKEFWNGLEFCTLVMAIITVAMYAMKMIFGKVAMSVLKESGSGQYVNFVTIGTWDETYGFILATVVFLATIKFINMLKFNRRMTMLTDTIRLASKDMKAFVVTFFLYFFAFCQFGYLLFGSQLQTYSGFANTIESLFSFALGTFDFDAFRMAQPVLGPVFFFLYIAIVFIGMQTMFLTIICEAFSLVRGNLQYQKNDYELVDYIVQKFKGLLGFGRRTNQTDEPQGHQDERH